MIQPVLKIDNPETGTVYTAGDTLTLQGSGADIDLPTLYFRWYATFNSHVTQDHYALFDAVTRPTDETVDDLPMGSHLIYFSATDQASEKRDGMKAIQRGSVAGGDDKGPSPCVIHVVEAAILAPLSGTTLQGTTVDLVAKAPVNWIDSADYRKLVFDWYLTDALGSIEYDFKIDQGELSFSAPPNGPSLAASRDLSSLGAYGPPFNFLLKVSCTARNSKDDTDTSTGVMLP